MKLSPDAESALMKTPKPGRATKLPSAVIPKLRIFPPSFSGPAFNSASIEPIETTKLLPVAVVSIRILEPETVSTSPNFMLMRSELNLNPDGTPPLNVSAARTASVFASGPSVNVIENALPGNRAAPPEAINTSPSNCTPPLKFTPKSEIPARISSSCRIEPKLRSPVY